MRQRTFWAAALLVAMLVNLGAVGALADDPILGGTVTTNPTAPSGTVTTSTTVPSTTTPVAEIITTQPITVTTTTTVNTTSTPVTGSVQGTGPGTTATVPITTTVSPEGTVPVLSTTTVVVPSVPTIDGTAGGTGASATVAEPANGIVLSAGLTTTVCLLANAVGYTTLDPAALIASLSTLCEGSASTASGTAGAQVSDLASASANLAAAICLVANTLALPSPISTEYLASAGLDTRCGTGPSTASLDSAATLFDAATINANGAAAVCLLAAALAGIPTTADLSTVCGSTSDGLTPSIISGGATGNAGTLGGAGVDLAAALCVVAHAVADLPASATLTTACGNIPSTLGGQAGGNVAGIGGNAAPNASTCIAVDSTVPGLTTLGQTCGTSPTTATQSGGSGGILGSQTDSRDGATLGGNATGGENATGDSNAPSGLLGIGSLPASATAIGGGALGLALIGLGVAFLRRRQTAS